MTVHRMVRVVPGARSGQTRSALVSSTIEGARADYRDYIRAMKEQRRTDARLSAQVEHEHNEERLDALAGVLRDRVRAPFNWRQHTASLPRPTLTPFAPPEPQRTAREARAEARSRAPLLAYVLGGSVAAIVALGSAQTWLHAPMVMAAALAGLAVVDVRSRRRALTTLTLQRYGAQHAQRVAAAQLQYQRDAVEREQAWQRDEADREAQRTAAERGDVSPLVPLLEQELANEALPVPLVFDIEFCSPEFVKLQLALPGIEIIPEQRSRLTKTGKISYRNMSKRDRLALYKDLCCGLALRLVYETYRVLPMVERVDITGIGDGLGGARVLALRHDTTRAMFTGESLGDRDASAVLTRLGGELSCTKDGVLGQLPSA